MADKPRIDVAPLPPETSPGSAQTIMLGLGALLLGVAAITFVGVAFTGLEPLSQLVILLAVAALFLAVPPPVAARGLGATAESLAAVGLVVASVAGYPLWEATGADATLATSVYVGLVAAATAGLGYGYYWLTRLTVGRWAALVALQPVLPLVAGPAVTGPAGWALVFALVAAQNLGLALAAGRRPLGLVSWILHGAGLLLSLVFSTAGLFLADRPLAAVPAVTALVLAGAVAAAGGLYSEAEPLRQLGTGLGTLTVIVAATRLAALALPERSLLPTALIMAGVAVAVLFLPPVLRRGPQLAASCGLIALGVVVAGLSVRAGVAAAVWPVWPAELTGYPARLTAAVELGGGWQLAATAAAATIAAGLTVPGPFRREVTVAGTGLTALAAPASLGLAPTAGAWVMVAATAGLALTGVTAPTRRAALAHLVAAGVTGVAALGVALAAPPLTAGILTALALTGAVVGSGRSAGPPAAPVPEWSAGVACLTLPAAAATSAVAAGFPPSAVLAATFAAVCVPLGYAAAGQLRRRDLPWGVRLGTVLATLVGVTVAVVLPGRTHPLDAGVALLLVGTGLLIAASTRIDTLRRADRRLDASDLAAAAVTVVVLVTLARIISLLLPVTGTDVLLATAAGLVLLMAVAVRSLPAQWRTGPVAGVAGLGTLVVGLAAAAGLAGAARALPVSLPWPAADPPAWQPGPTLLGISWSAPFALALLAVAAATVLPVPTRYRATPVLVALTVVSAANGFGLPAWGPAALATTAGAGYALLAVGPPPRLLPGPVSGRLAPRPAAWPRAAAATALFGYAVGAGLTRPSAAAMVLAVVTLIGVMVASWAAGRNWPDPRRTVGGLGLAGALAAFPAGLAALTVGLGGGAVLTQAAALAGTGLALAVVAVLTTLVGPGRYPAPYPGCATIGVAVAASGTALAGLATTGPAAVYPAAAVLLVVLAELLRAGRYRAGDRLAPLPLVTPPVGALLAAAVPAAVALAAIAPALMAALVDPYRSLTAVWQGPPAVLLDTGAVPATSVLAALLITLATALAAVGFGGVVTRQTVPLIAPGLAVTLLITPAALGAPWPVGTLAALAVSTLAMLGLALTPPPPRDRVARPLRANRVVVLTVGLAAGGAGLAGSFADPLLTWGTFAAGVGVGVTAAVAGRTGLARLSGWLGAALAAQLFALTTAALLGAGPARTGFGLLLVAAVALLLVPWLPGLRQPGRGPERAAVATFGGYLPLLLALLLVVTSEAGRHLPALLVGAGAVLGLVGLRPEHSHLQRRVLWWTGALAEVAAWWILAWRWDVGVIEAYTLPLALFALLVGGLEIRHRPQLGSWATYGPGLVAAFGPSLVLTLIASSPDPVRHTGVILSGVAAVLAGSRWSQRAPLIIGAVVTALGALHLLSLAGPWLVLVPVGLLLLVLGANREKRARDLARLRGAYSRMR